MALFQALEGSADVIGRDGLVTANELFVYLDEALQDATIAAGKRQTPGLWPLRKHGKGQFVFFVPDAISRFRPRRHSHMKVIRGVASRPGGAHACGVESIASHATRVQIIAIPDHGRRCAKRSRHSVSRSRFNPFTRTV
jgi:hypothetical protein